MRSGRFASLCGALSRTEGVRPMRPQASFKNSGSMAAGAASGSISRAPVRSRATELVWQLRCFTLATTTMSLPMMISCITTRGTETPGWDAAQIAATKNASTLGIPVFVITASPKSASRKRVRLGWVQGWDDASAQFLVVFGEEPPGLPPLPADADPFVATQRSSVRMGSAKRRVGQARFRFDVLRRCGPQCAMCGIRVMHVLETPHVVPVADCGTNDPRNGMVMCATHHRAFDTYFFAIEPESLTIDFAPHGPSGKRAACGDCRS